MVYCHTNKINGKRYVGMTGQNPSSRWSNGTGYVGCRYFYRAIQKYGWDSFDHEILEDNLSFEDACRAEQRYIAEFHSLYCENGYNIDTGGALPHNLSPEGLASMKEKISRGNHPKARPVVVFDLNGKKLFEFPCVRDASEYMGFRINYSPIEAGIGTCHGYIIRFKDDVGDVDRLPAEMLYSVHDMSRFSGSNSPFSVPVVLFDAKTGERIADFGSVSEADKFVGARISGALTGVNKTCCGYVCRYAKDVVGIDRISTEKLPVKKKTSKAVLQYDLDGNLLASYQSAREAQKSTGISYKAISLCVRRVHKTSGGFIWKFAGEETF